jgi:hypothetical protein
LKRQLSRDIDRKVKHLSGLVALGVSVVLLSQACGSEDDKKKSPPVPYEGRGGEGGDGPAAGGSSNPADAGQPGSGNAAGTGGTPSTTGGGTPSMTGGGTPSMTGDAGTANSAGSSGAGGNDSGDGCEPGMGECDGDPETVCEQPLSLITSCGDCTTKCNATNGVPSCEDGQCVFACSDGYADCDGEGDNGCEVTLATDAANCGACGRDCAMYGATCGARVCSNVALQSDFSSDGFGAWAFSPLGMIHSGRDSYSVRRFMLDSPSTLTIWAPTQKTSPAQGLLVVDGDVYWSERGANSAKYQGIVYKKAITAAAGVLPTPVFSPEFVASFLRRSGNALYWATGGYQDDASLPGGGGFIYTRAIDAAESDSGTRIVTVDQGNWDNIRQLGVTSNALYWVTSLAGTGTAYELRTAPLSGSPITVVPAVFPNASLALAVYPFDYKTHLVPHGQYIYFNRIAGDAQDGVYRYKTGLTRPERIVLASYVTSVVVDDLYVYFVQHNVQGVWRAPINEGAGGAAEKVADGYVSRVLAVDDTFVYAINGEATANTDLFKIIK